MSTRQRKHHERNGNVVKGKIQSFHLITMTTGDGSLSIDDLVSDVTADLGLVYRYYRFTRIKVTCVGSNSATLHTIAYAPPQTNLSAYNVLESAFLMVYNAAVNTLPLSFTVPFAFLQGLGNWLVTQQDANSNIDFERVGTILVSNAGSASGQCYLKLDIDYEFRDPINAASLSERQKIRNAIRQKRKAVEETPFKQVDKPCCLNVGIISPSRSTPVYNTNNNNNKH